MTPVVVLSFLCPTWTGPHAHPTAPCPTCHTLPILPTTTLPIPHTYTPHTHAHTRLPLPPPALPATATLGIHTCCQPTPHLPGQHCLQPSGFWVLPGSPEGHAHCPAPTPTPSPHRYTHPYRPHPRGAPFPVYRRGLLLGFCWDLRLPLFAVPLPRRYVAPRALLCFFYGFAEDTGCRYGIRRMGAAMDHTFRDARAALPLPFLPFITYPRGSALPYSTHYCGRRSTASMLPNKFGWTYADRGGWSDYHALHTATGRLALAHAAGQHLPHRSYLRLLPRHTADALYYHTPAAFRACLTHHHLHTAHYAHFCCGYAPAAHRLLLRL